MKTIVDSARRGFLWKAGAALSAPLAIAAASAHERDAEDDPTLQARLARLEHVNAIRELNRRYARHVNAGAHDEAARLFADAARAGPAGIRTIAADPLGGEDAIEIDARGEHATSRVFCTVQTETPIEPVTPLVAMARAQGGGVARRSQRGVLEGSYVKRDGVWKIDRLAFRAA
jgi:hypothetical protein